MDYREKAIDELRILRTDYTAEKLIRERIADIESSMTSVGGGSNGGMPKGGGNKTEEKWLNLLANAADEDIRYRQVKKRIKRVEAALNAISTDEARLLKLIYVEERKIEECARVMHISRATAYRLREDALISFTRSLYGAVVT